MNGVHYHFHTDESFTALREASGLLESATVHGRSYGTPRSEVREALERGEVLAVFPEGTTSDGTGLLPFKSSLLSALDPPPPGIAIQPVWIDYGPQALRIRAQGMDHRVHEVHRYRIAFAHLLPIFRIWQKTPAFLRGCGIGEPSRQTLDSMPSLAVTAWRACNFNRHQRGADHST